MSILEDLKTTLTAVGIPFETTVWSKTAPDKYIVILPVEDTFDLYGDNSPDVTIQEARISLFVKGNYIAEKDKLIRKLLSDEYTITYASYIGYETETKFNHYNIDVAKYYYLKEET